MKAKNYEVIQSVLTTMYKMSNLMNGIKADVEKMRKMRLRGEEADLVADALDSLESLYDEIDNVSDYLDSVEEDD